MQINDPAHPVSFMPLINVKLIQAEKEIGLIFGKSFGLWLSRTFRLQYRAIATILLIYVVPKRQKIGLLGVLAARA